MTLDREIKSEPSYIGRLVVSVFHLMVDQPVTSIQEMKTNNAFPIAGRTFEALLYSDVL